MVFPLPEMASSDPCTTWKPLMDSAWSYLILKQFKNISMEVTQSQIQINMYQDIPHLTWISSVPAT